jgi:hypothetical protein
LLHLPQPALDVRFDRITRPAEVIDHELGILRSARGLRHRELATRMDELEATGFQLAS